MRDRLAERLLALADRIERLKPLNHDPDAYFVEKDEIRRTLMREAETLGARRPDPAPRGRFEAGAVAVQGRMVRAEVRRARRPRAAGA